MGGRGSCRTCLFLRPEDAWLGLCHRPGFLIWVQFVLASVDTWSQECPGIEAYNICQVPPLVRNFDLPARSLIQPLRPSGGRTFPKTAAKVSSIPRHRSHTGASHLEVVTCIPSPGIRVEV